MFNLLPEIFKEEIKSEYKLRRWIVALSLVLFLLVSFLVMAFSMWIISMDKEEDVTQQIEKQKETLTSQNANDILNVINSTNKKLSIFDKVMKYPEILPIYNTIISNKTPEISLRGFSYLIGQTETNVVVTGISGTREALVAFVKNLNDSGSFTSVDLPVSNLAKQKNLEFNISIKIKN